MKYLTILLLAMLSSCSTPHKINGFYAVGDYPDDVIIGKPIVTVPDFERVSLNSSTGTLFIDGKLDPAATKRFADATERLQGHRIGFVFNDSIIMAPQINCRIESGNFQIISADTSLIRRIYTHIMLSNVAK